jgi:hypothetical protein
MLPPGFLVMLRSGLATNPYALMAIVCTVTAIVAPITLTEYKYAIFLGLITFDSLILCQYRQACTPSPTSMITGSWEASISFQPAPAATAGNMQRQSPALRHPLSSKEFGNLFPPPFFV